MKVHASACSGVRPNARGFTLLEILVTLAIIGVWIFPLIALREGAVNQLIESRNSDWARALARELLTELEFHELDRYAGPVDGYPGFEFQIEVQEVDLVTGEGDPEAEQREKDKKDKRLDSANDDPDSRFRPSDSVIPEDEKQELVYPVRKVKLTLTYPNMHEDK